MRVGLVQLTVIRYSQTVSNKVSFQSVARREESRSLVAPRLVTRLRLHRWSWQLLRVGAADSPARAQVEPTQQNI